ncbi:MAG: protein kinase [Thermodesulfovibrionales bacterium]|nr:protein kinase [Thermodesulfovibrionales bacterium]
MKKPQERRQWPREVIDPPKTGIIYSDDQKKEHSDGKKKPHVLYINVLNMSDKGLLFQSPVRFRQRSTLNMRIWNHHEKGWMAVHGRVVWVNHDPSRPDYFLIGIENREEKPALETAPSEGLPAGRTIYPSDLEFLLDTKLFQAVPRESLVPLLNSLKFEQFRKGERLIAQGDEGDCFYIIRKGSCIVSIEKDNTLHPVARLKAGDVVGEMAVLTGEKRSSHVDAETDVEVWSLASTQFDELAREYPDLRNFLTEIITERLSSLKMTSARRIGKYVIRDVLGQGAWSIVYKGNHVTLNFPVAIKMMKHTMAMDHDFQEKFQNEAKTIAGLNHANIVKVYDIEEMYRTLFIIMEYLEGYSLEEHLENMPKMPLPAVLDILLQVCNGLEYAHKHGIVHQDIKPANVFIQPDGQIKIVDFGLACPAGNVDFDLPGTAYYMAPEQIQGEPVDARTDIYSLGILVYEMMTGGRPFPEDTIALVMDKHLNEDGPDPRLLIPELPSELSEFVMMCIRKSPDERPQNVAQIIDMLSPLGERFGVTCQPRIGKKPKIMGMFLFYEEEHQLALNNVIDAFHGTVEELGARLHVTPIEEG